MISEQASTKSKKIYEEPVLRVYGNIQSLTGTTSGSLTTSDGGPKGKFDKTA
jgi:hypothetical protein